MKKWAQINNTQPFFDFTIPHRAEDRVIRNVHEIALGSFDRWIFLSFRVCPTKRRAVFTIFSSFFDFSSSPSLFPHTTLTQPFFSEPPLTNNSSNCHSFSAFHRSAHATLYIMSSIVHAYRMRLSNAPIKCTYRICLCTIRHATRQDNT